MGSEWRIGTLRDALGEKGYIRGPFGSALRRPELKTNGIPVYEQQHAITGTREFRFYIDEQKYQSMKRFAVQPDDLIVSCSGTLARVSMICSDDPIGIISQALLILRPDKTVVWPKYLYYFMSSKRGYDSLTGVSTGSVQVNIARRSIIEKTELPLPPLPEQHAIAHILGSLDDKIELNRRMNQTLQAMARAIFKHWFIDFEFPNENGESYKSSGGEMIDSPLGPIPVGWRVGFINDIEFEIVPGDWGKGELSERYSSPVRCIRGADIREISSGGIGNPPLRYIKPLSAEVKSLRDTDVVVEISGGSPTQQTGRAMRIIEPITKKFAENLICSNFCKLLRFRNIEDSEFTYFLLDNLYRREIMFQYENGTTGIKNLDFKNLFSTEQVVIPNRKVLQQFAGYSRQIDSMIQLNGIQNMMLSRIRDSLLPKLMSGEIRVPVSDKEVDQF
ncbi:MAG TPA: restriction endonuclease subunit S [Mesotoga sp.]|nr:restriction endonuclease subunit S [Mesotoga sp.]